jgi:hypothetical protein
MNDDSILRTKVRSAIRTGTLPDSRPERMWGGPGDGTPCGACDKPLNCDEIGFELQFTRAGTSSPACVQFHVQCYAAWDHELRDRAARPPSAPVNALPPTLTGAPESELLSCKDCGGIMPDLGRDTTY